MRRVLLICLCTTFVLTGCGGWTVEPLPYLSPSPFPTATPLIFSPTPVILLPPFAATAGTPTFELSPTPSLTVSATSTPTSDSSGTSGSTTPAPVITTKILGCDTSLDVIHGMGEVTNAYITISNVGGLELNNVCATLQALDEGRTHPDKTKCVALLPAGYQVTEKLTVDTTLHEASPVQVDVNSDGNLLERVGQNACRNLGLFPPDLGALGVVTPIAAGP